MRDVAAGWQVVVAAPQRLVRAMAGVALPERPLAEIVAERRRLVQLLGWSPWPLTALLVAGHLVTAVSPVLLALATGRLVAALVAGADAAIAAPIAFFVAVLLARQVGEITTETAGVVVSREIDRRVRRTVREVALAPAGIERLAEPSYQDELRRAGPPPEWATSSHTSIHIDKLAS